MIRELDESNARMKRSDGRKLVLAKLANLRLTFKTANHQIIIGGKAVGYQNINPDLPSLLDWRRSMQCGTEACVEIAISDHKAFVRSSTSAAGTYLVFDAEEWRSFLAGVRNNEFDID